jgi:hypothetical protein
MSNDTFIREVNEEIRQERMRTIWRRYGFVIIGLIAAVVLGTIAYVVWERMQAERAAADGDRLIAAQALIEQGDLAGAEAALAELASSGTAGYPALAQMQLAGTRQQAGDLAGAIEAYDAVAGNTGAARALRDIAAIRAAYILVDTGTPDDVRQRVEVLSAEDEPMRHPALEAIGLSLWKAGQAEDAAPFFNQLADDFATPPALAERARMMQELIEARTGAAAPASDPAAPTAPATGDVPAQGAQ